MNRSSQPAPPLKLATTRLSTVPRFQLPIQSVWNPPERFDPLDRSVPRYCVDQSSALNTYRSDFLSPFTSPTNQRSRLRISPQPGTLRSKRRLLVMLPPVERSISR